MQAYYKEGQPSSRLQNLTLLMIRKSTSSSPKLRAKAAEARSLVSFARAIAEELEKTIKQAARLLEVCYQNLRYYQHDEMLQCAAKFLLLIAPLEDLEQKTLEDQAQASCYAGDVPARLESGRYLDVS